MSFSSLNNALKCFLSYLFMIFNPVLYVYMF